MTSQGSDTPERTAAALAAPGRLTADQRVEFRQAVLEALDLAARRGADTVEVDLRATTEIDVSGLGVLVLLQKRASEQRITTRLTNAPRIVREMLEATRLGALFEVAPS